LTAVSERAPQQAGRVQRWTFVVVLAVHLAVLYWPHSPSTGGLPIDKVVHAAIFGMVLWAAARAGLPVRPVAILLAVHAVVSELIQHYLLAGRSGDPTDSIADLAGVAIVTVFLWRRK
jgi:VanZ like protein